MATRRLRLHEAIRENQTLDAALKLLWGADGPTSAMEKDGRGRLGLHRIAEHQGRLTRSQNLNVLERNRKRITDILLRANPEGVKTMDSEGNLPIHYAVQNPLNSLEYIKDLVQAYPESLGVPNASQQLPIHLAIDSWARETDETIGFLIETFPKALEVEDAMARLPVHLAMLKANRFDVSDLQKIIGTYPLGLQHSDSIGCLPLHYAIAGHVPLCVHTLIATYADGLKHRNNAGDLPVHIAAKRGTLDALKLIVEKHPAGLHETDAVGKLPLHLAIRRVANLESHSMIKFLSKLDQESGDRRRCEAILEEKKQLELRLKQKEEDLKGEKDRSQHARQDKEKLKEAKDQEKQAHATEKRQLETTLGLYKQFTSQSRELEKRLLSRVIPDGEATLEELKCLATSLKTRLDLLKAEKVPNAKRSLSQLMFPTFIATQDLSKGLLVDCIEQLNAELIGLESDLSEDGTCNDAFIAVPDTSASCEESRTIPTSRPTKKPRVSLP